jgi:hypothetical protein
MQPLAGPPCDSIDELGRDYRLASFADPPRRIDSAIEKPLPGRSEGDWTYDALPTTLALVSSTKPPERTS